MKKILVIFLLSTISTIIIYNSYYDKKENILIICDNNYILDEKIVKNNNILFYKYDNVNYKELINSIKSNEGYISKRKKIYLNQLISKTDYLYIIISSSGKCNTDIYKNQLISIIKRISNSKITIINPN